MEIRSFWECHGSGKSFTAKHEITSIALKDPNADIIILDPENEYAPLIKELGGEVIKISASSDNHINALDLNKDYSENHRPIVAKAEFILSLCEQIIKNITPNQKAIIDRCTNIVYKYYEQGITFFKTFYGTTFKDNPYLEKTVLTGVSRVAKESIFSGANNFDVYTVLDDEFSDDFGITEKEMNKVIEDFEVQDEKEEIKKWYDGYTIGNTKGIYKII